MNFKQRVQQVLNEVEQPSINDLANQWGVQWFTLLDGLERKFGKTLASMPPSRWGVPREVLEGMGPWIDHMYEFLMHTPAVLINDNPSSLVEVMGITFTLFDLTYMARLVNSFPEYDPSGTWALKQRRYDLYKYLVGYISLDQPWDVSRPKVLSKKIWDEVREKLHAQRHAVLNKDNPGVDIDL
jgi:hypothetical protein